MTDRYGFLTWPGKTHFLRGQPIEATADIGPQAPPEEVLGGPSLGGPSPVQLQQVRCVSPVREAWPFGPVRREMEIEPWPWRL